MRRRQLRQAELFAESDERGVHHVLATRNRGEKVPGTVDHDDPLVRYSTSQSNGTGSSSGRLWWNQITCCATNAASNSSGFPTSSTYCLP